MSASTVFSMPYPDLKPVPSPCISVCRMNDATGLCEGCLRTLSEIAAWGSLNDTQRHAVLLRIRERRAQAQI